MLVQPLHLADHGVEILDERAFRDFRAQIRRRDGVAVDDAFQRVGERVVQEMQAREVAVQRHDDRALVETVAQEAAALLEYGQIEVDDGAAALERRDEHGGADQAARRMPPARERFGPQLLRLGGLQGWQTSGRRGPVPPGRGRWTPFK